MYFNIRTLSSPFLLQSSPGSLEIYYPQAEGLKLYLIKKLPIFDV